MTQWFPLFLLLHVLAAIIAFGPIFTFPLIGRMGGAEPQHANFSTRVSAAVSRRITIPAALTMPVSGVLMIWATGINPAQLWLITGIALYVFAVAYAILVQGRAVERLIALTSGPPPSAGLGAVAGVPGAPAGGPSVVAGGPGALAGGPGAPAGGMGAVGGGTGAARTGPPPEVAATIARIQQGGILLMVVIIVIVTLMVVRPTI